MGRQPNVISAQAGDQAPRPGINGRANWEAESAIDISGCGRDITGVCLCHNNYEVVLLFAGG